MGGSNFAGVLQRRSNRIARVLVYAVLEWTLISLLLLNSLFSLLIHRFARFVGLKPPCILCSRLDKSKDSSFSLDIICENHAAQISRIGYCSHHRKLVESQSLCLDCSSSSSSCSSAARQRDDGDGDGDAAVFSWMSEIGIVRRCSCCDGIIKLSYDDDNNNSSHFGSPCFGVSGDPDVGSLAPAGDSVISQRGLMMGADPVFGYEILGGGDDDEEQKEGEEREREVGLEAEKEPLLIKDNNDEINKKEIVVSDGNINLCPEMLPQHLEFYIDHDDYRLIPVDLVNTKEVILGGEEAYSKEFELVFEGDELLSSGFKFVSRESLPSIQEEEDEEKMGISQPHQEENKNFASLQEVDEDKMEISQPQQEQEEEKIEISQPRQEEEVGEKMEISQPHVEQKEIEEEEKMIGSAPSDDAKLETEAGNTIDIVAGVSKETLKVNVGLSNAELEDERIPETPTSVESLHNLHNKMLLLGRRESATEESLDGSMVSEVEGGDGTATVEKLKSELQAERKALRALYKELEEERSASAIAANQTMAMINRLQEEKATMQMEALQYQRMLEEQSEYDQEALQMMNELMVKREKEKQELEKQLEVLRKKVADYEERERVRVLCRRREGSMRSRNSSASCSYGEESDGLSIDLNHEAKDHEEDGTLHHSGEENGHQDTPSEAVLGLQESLASFEVERQTILEQLKALEEKLFTLAEDEEEHIENMKPFEQFYEENGKDFDSNGGDNEFSYVNGKHQQERKLNGSMQKRLLPLFDATELMESPDGVLEGREAGFDYLESNKSPIVKFELEKKRLAIEEEVDHVYERLQALEADREFLKHCIGSLRKGDKGLDLLQEILQHLRDLKSVELQAMKNMDHCASI